MSEKQKLLMPPEWAEHKATWMAWPAAPSDWPRKSIAASWAVVEIIRILVDRGEQVCLLVQERDARKAMRALERAHVDTSEISLFNAPYDRSWLRDTGPTFVRGEDGGRFAVCWVFNAWGEKYSNFSFDRKIGMFIQKSSGALAVHPMHKDRLVVMEGGAFDVDGEGLVMVTEECLLSSVNERNPGFNRQDYEEIFAKYLGATRTIWLAAGIEGDDTGGHVDDVARFVGTKHMVVPAEYNRADANYETLNLNNARLRAAGVKVTELPMPSPLFFNRVRLPASYMNFYVANRVVLVPTFNDPNDRYALAIIAGLFPKREVIGIHAVDLVWGFGTVHCLTQQQPT